MITFGCERTSADGAIPKFSMLRNLPNNVQAQRIEALVRTHSSQNQRWNTHTRSTTS